MDVFIFRRDFRIHDNVTLYHMLSQSKLKRIPVLFLFIYNDDQIKPKQNKYFCNNAMQFLVTSLNDLQNSIQQSSNNKGDLLKISIKNTIKESDAFSYLNKITKIRNLYFNMDLTPFARNRDALLKQKCDDLGINVVSFEDYTLFEMESKKTKTQNGSPYQIFSFFYKKRNILHNDIPLLYSNELKDVLFVDISKFTSNKTYKVLNRNEDLLFFKRSQDIRGGRIEALKISQEKLVYGDMKEYKNTRNDVSNEKGTTRLSAYLKYGCISIRELYRTIFEAYGIDHDLIRELYFREFYYNIAWHFPKLLGGMNIILNSSNNNDIKTNMAFLSHLQIEWKKDDKGFELWKCGKTGTPLVDAGMRQLIQTGYMHNRCRMIVAMYLTKDLLIDWRCGEKFFASLLIDYDPIQNNAGWQWSASVGTDAAPYFRVMNPYIQSKRFDKDAKYIKTWVPELSDVKPQHIHEWEDINIRKLYKVNYPAPYIRNHTKTIKENIKRFQ
jgi:deoxyribodipyrimidine photo-lyase